MEDLWNLFSIELGIKNTSTLAKIQKQIYCKLIIG